jgi:4-oxalocrotonate tautomerase
MPVIRFENAGDLTKEQKNELIEKMTEVVVAVTGKPAQYVYVKIEEVEREDFGIGGKPLV